MKFVTRPKKGQEQATAWWSSCRLFNLQAKTELTSGLEVSENKVKLNRTETAPVLLSNFQSFLCVLSQQITAKLALNFTQLHES